MAKRYEVRFGQRLHDFVEVLRRHPVITTFLAAVLHARKDGPVTDIDIVRFFPFEGKNAAAVVEDEERLTSHRILAGDNEPPRLNNVGLDDARGVSVAVLPPVRLARLEGARDAR